MRLQTPGEIIWKWLVNAANDASPLLSNKQRWEPLDIFVTFKITIGKFREYRTQRFNLRYVTTKILDQVLPNPQMYNVKCYVLVERYLPRSGWFQFWLRVPMLYNQRKWVEIEAFKSSNNIRVQMQEDTLMAQNIQKYLRTECDRRYASYRIHSDKPHASRWGSWASGNDRANPSILNGNNVIASEDTVTPYHVTGYRVYEKYRRSYVSVGTPNFRKTKPSRLPVNPYSSTTTITLNGQGMDSRKGTSSGFSNVWDGTAELWSQALPSTTPSYDVRTYNRCVQKLLERSQVELNADLGTDLAQIGQTVRMITDTADRITRSLICLKKGNIIGATDALLANRKNAERIKKKMRLAKSKALADNWLELQYGWKPLLNDIDGAMRSTANFLVQSDAIREVSASSKITTKGIAGVEDLLYPQLRIGYRNTTTDYVTRMGLRFRIDDHLKSYLAQTGFTNPLNLGWELIPFSFVVDWFLPIGPYLSCLNSWDGLTFVDGYRTDLVHEFVFVEINVREWPTPDAGEFWNKYGIWTRETIKMDRVKLTSLPSKRFPSLKNPFSTTHALNALALMTTTFAEMQKEIPGYAFNFR